MDDLHEHHEELVSGLYQQLKTIFEKSEQAIYLYLDDNHKTCNKKFADLLGYGTVNEWVKMDAPLSDVVEEDQDKVVKAYTEAMEKMTASDISVRVRNVKMGKTIEVGMIMVPIMYNGHLFALHFIS